MGWAEDYVAAMYLMLQQEQFSFRWRSVSFREEAIAKQTLRYRQRMTIKVAKRCLEQVATGESYKLAEFVEIAFGVGGVRLAGVCGDRLAIS